MNMNAESVVLVRVRVACPGETKKDDMLTEKMKKDMGADEGWLTARKRLFDIREITRHRDRMRKILRDRAVPWTATKTDAHGNKKSDPLWAVPGGMAEELLEDLSACREAWQEAIRNYDYDEQINKAQAGMGAAFNRAEFPTKKEFESRFEWETEVVPLMDVADAEKDFRLKVPDKYVEDQVEKYKKNLDRKVETGVREIMSRTIDQLVGTNTRKGIIERLREYDPDPEDKRKGNTFRDKSLYEKMDEYREWVGHMNTFLDSEELAELEGRIGDFCDNVRPEDPEEIRTNDDVRQNVIDGLLGILDGTKTEDDSGGSTGAGFDQLL